MSALGRKAVGVE